MWSDLSKMTRRELHSISTVKFQLAPTWVSQRTSFPRRSSYKALSQYFGEIHIVANFFPLVQWVSSRFFTDDRVHYTNFDHCLNFELHYCDILFEILYWSVYAY